MQRRELVKILPLAVLTGVASCEPIAETCSICKFYLVLAHNNKQGMCRRYPLDYKYNSIGSPTVKATDWCGEFKAK